VENDDFDSLKKTGLFFCYDNFFVCFCCVISCLFLVCNHSTDVSLADLSNSQEDLRAEVQKLFNLKYS
jgi:hypothetical protein